MGFNANKVETPQGTKSRGVSPPLGGTELTKQEIEVLLNLIRNSTFSGSTLDILYTLVVKLQKQYKNQE
tara:strand:+ start:474 stop:680 length:207 start_codon:yes stop_codon:yes gene_type:complete